MSDTECVFCKIVREEIPAEVIYEEDEIIAFKDINPRTPAHALVIPKQHIASLAEVRMLSADVGRGLLEVAHRVAGKLNIADTGYVVRINNGSDAGQEVYHLHLHVMGGRRIGMP